MSNEVEKCPICGKPISTSSKDYEKRHNERIENEQIHVQNRNNAGNHTNEKVYNIYNSKITVIIHE